MRREAAGMTSPTMGTDGNGAGLDAWFCTYLIERSHAKHYRITGLEPSTKQTAEA